MTRRDTESLGIERWLRLAPLLLALAAASGAAVAQEEGLASFLDTVEVRVVNVDVVVVDAEGYPLRGLEREDFELYEDGVRVELSNFAAYDETLAAVSRSEAPVPGAGDPVAAGGEGPLPPPPVTWLIYVDQSRLDPGPRNTVLRQAQEFLDRVRRPGEKAMVATWDGQRLRRVTDLSDSERATRSALVTLQREVAPTAAARNQAILLKRQLEEYASPVVGGAATTQEAAISSVLTEGLIESLRLQIDQMADEEARQTRAALDAFRDLLVMTNAIEGRVAILFVGGGFDLDPGDAAMELWSTRIRGSAPLDSASPESGTRSARLHQEYARLLETVNGGRATVYTIFAGEERGVDATADDPSSSGRFGEVSSSGGAAGARSNFGAFAEATGGRRFAGASGLADRLEAARSDLGIYYSLGYQPDPDRTPGFHRLEVRVRREGVRVRHRTGIALFGLSEDVGAAAIQALIGVPPQPSPGREIRIGDSQPARRRRERLVPVEILLPVREITLLPAGAVHRGILSLHYAIEDPDGAMSRLEPRRMEFEIPNEELAAALDKQVRYSVELRMTDGPHRLGVAVRDEIGGGHFTLVAPIEATSAR